VQGEDVGKLSVELLARSGLAPTRSAWVTGDRRAGNYFSFSTAVARSVLTATSEQTMHETKSAMRDGRLEHPFLLSRHVPLDSRA
jgi:hypothetical protein